MNSIEQFLSEAPKVFLNKIHQKNLNQGGGLIRNAKLVSDITEWAADSQRLQTFVNELAPLQQNMVRAIYAAGSRGLTKQQLHLSLPENERFLLKDTLLRFQWNLISYSTHSEEGERIYGFIDLKPIIFEILPATLAEDASKLQWLDNSMMPSFHFISLAGQLQVKPWKLSQNLEPHRRNFSSMESRLEFSSSIDLLLAKTELDILIKFGRESGYFHHSDGEMVLDKSFYKSIQSLGQFHQEMVAWWIEQIQWTEQHLHDFIQRYAQPVQLEDSLNDWWVLEDVSFIPKLTKTYDDLKWADLPKSILEAWVLGLVQVSSLSQQLGCIQLTPLFKSIIEGTQYSDLYFDQPAFSTPDFEVVVGVQQQCQHLFTLECITKATTDDRVMKFKIDKTRFLEGLKSGLTLTQVEDCLNWIQLPPTPRISVTDWMNSFKEASFSRPLVLEILSESTRNTLKGIPNFSEHIITELPGFGFILRDSGEKDAKFLLEQLGFFPSFGQEEETAASRPFPHPKLDNTENTVEVSTLYPTQEPAEEGAIQMGELSQYGKSFKELHPAEILRILKYCIICDISIEVFWKEKTSKKAIVQPQEIDSETQEILRALDEKTNEKIEIPIQSISNLKIQEGI